MQRPEIQTARPAPEAIKATGDCAKCHRNETGAIVHQYEKGAHVREGVTCLDCHKVQDNQTSFEHHDYTLTEEMTRNNCSNCHPTQYDQYLRSRHGTPAWAAVHGAQDFTQEQIAFAE